MLRVRVGQKEPPRPGSTICYGYAWAKRSHAEPGVRFVTDKNGPERATKAREYDLLRIRVGQQRATKTREYLQITATKTREYDLLRIRVGQKEPPRKSHQDPGIRCETNKCGPETATRTTDKSGPERATKTREYDLLRVRVGQKELPTPQSTICYG